MAIIQAQGRGLEPLIEVLLNEKKLSQEKERIGLEKKDLELRQQQEAERQTALAGRAQLLAGLLQLAPPQVREGIGPTEALPVAQRAAIVDELQQSTPMFDQARERAAAARSQADLQKILAQFPEDVRPGVETAFMLRQAELPADVITDLTSRVLPETDRQKLDRLIDEQTLVRGRAELGELMKGQSATEWVTQTVFPELAAAGLTVPASVAQQALSAIASDRVKDPREMLLSLAETIATKTAIDPATLQPTFVATPEQAIGRAEDIIRNIFPGVAPVLSDEQRQELAIVSDMSNAINMNSLAEGRDRLPDARLNERIMEVARERYPGVDDATLRRLLGRARSKASLF